MGLVWLRAIVALSALILPINVITKYLTLSVCKTISTVGALYLLLNIRNTELII